MTIKCKFLLQKIDLDLVKDVADVTRISADNATSVALDSKGGLFMWGHSAHPVVSFFFFSINICLTDITYLVIFMN